MGKRLAVIFPGIGYHCDKPILYYSRKLAKEQDVAIVVVTHDDRMIPLFDKIIRVNDGYITKE